MLSACVVVVERTQTCSGSIRYFLKFGAVRCLVFREVRISVVMKFGPAYVRISDFLERFGGLIFVFFGVMNPSSGGSKFEIFGSVQPLIMCCAHF